MLGLSILIKITDRLYVVMIEKVLLFVNLSLLILHEMDAVYCKEWKMFAFLKKLSDSKGRLIFSALHFPLFVLIFLLVEYKFEIIFWVLNVFLVFHFLVHLLMRTHKYNGFKSNYSSFLILIMGIIGTVSIVFKILI